MTRINCVPVSTLTNEHLVAEYKESTRPFRKVAVRLQKGKDVPIINGEYRLGKGHETFFFNKLAWLAARRASIIIEMISRGMKPDMDKFYEIADAIEKELAHTMYWGWWIPTPEDMYVNMARLCHRHFQTDLSEFN